MLSGGKIKSKKRGGQFAPDSVVHFAPDYTFFGQSAFHDIIDLLRNEKPIYFLWKFSHKTNDGRLVGQVTLSSSPEPIGEGEDDILKQKFPQNIQ